MKNFKENDVVIYTDKEGNRFDTFVIFGNDIDTGLVHINHHNLKVSPAFLELHPSAFSGNAMPFADPYSFMLFSKLKEKYEQKAEVAEPVILYTEPKKTSLAKAS
ncbi:MAG: hypothetical protein ACHQF4_01770 [Sphingobacteriales bacterium]